MPLNLTAPERRILGCLLEKSVVTPDQYPLTLNALIAACNQKSSRDPVMNLASGEVERTARTLEAQHLLRREENFRSRVDKFVQRFCNTPFSDYQFEPDEFAVITLLLLRGPATPGELKSRSGRLHSFADQDAVLATLDKLANAEGGALVRKLAMRAGRRDHEYIDCLSSHDDLSSAADASVPVPAAAPAAASAIPTPASTGSGSTGNLADRVAQLEAEVAELKAKWQALEGGPEP